MPRSRISLQSVLEHSVAPLTRPLACGVWAGINSTPRSAIARPDCVGFGQRDRDPIPTRDSAREREASTCIMNISDHTSKNGNSPKASGYRRAGYLESTSFSSGIIESGDEEDDLP